MIRTQSFCFGADFGAKPTKICDKTFDNQNFKQNKKLDNLNNCRVLNFC